MTRPRCSISSRVGRSTANAPVSCADRPRPHRGRRDRAFLTPYGAVQDAGTGARYDGILVGRPRHRVAQERETVRSQDLSERAIEIEREVHNAAGAAKRLITPELKPGANVRMAGFANGRAATGVHDDLWTRCLAMSSGGKPVVVCSVDVIGLFFEDVKKVRDGARAKLKREVDVIVASTHVHEGPDTPNRSEARTPC